MKQKVSRFQRFRAALVVGLILLAIIPTMVFAADGISQRTTGWARADNMTYASSTTVTVSGDKTAKYGDKQKVRFAQSAANKYYEINGTPTYSAETKLTTITLTGDTVANSSVTYEMYSWMATPHEFPLNRTNQTVNTLRGVAITAPSAPGTAGWIIYGKTITGKENLCALFDTGVEQCFATEP